MSKNPVIISCFSYKGGAGRSTGAANIAGALTFLGKTVCIVDCDYEGTGLGLLYVNNLQPNLSLDSKDTKRKILPDYYNDNIEESFKENFIYTGSMNERKFYYIDSGFGETRATNNLIANFSNLRGSDLSGNDDQNMKIFHKKTEKLIHLIKESIPDCEFIIFDLQSGLRLFSTVHLQLSDKVLLFFRYSAQHVEGTIKTFKNLRLRIPKKLDYWLIPSAIPIESTLDEEFNLIIDDYKKRIIKSGKNFYYPFDDKILEIKENNLLKVKEQNLFFGQNRWQNLRKIISSDVVEEKKVNNILNIIDNEDKFINESDNNIKTMIEFLKIACKIQV